MPHFDSDDASQEYDVLIVGGGVSGVGTGLCLKHAGVERYLILERHEIGASFARWPAEMRFITPSFNSNQFGWLDLNSPGLGLSPAFSLGREHPTGPDFAEYLINVVNFLKLPVRTGIEVRAIEMLTDQEGFRVATSQGDLRSRYIIWAAGEFQYPRLGGFPGAEHCVHNSSISSWRKLEGDDYIVIGGYESGIDAAVNLVACGKSVRVLEAGDPWKADGQDPSVSLSPWTSERLEYALETERLELFANSSVRQVEKRKQGGFQALTADGSNYTTPVPPILATGFDSSLKLVKNLFDWKDGKAQLTDQDESTRTPGFFLVGPQVFHDQIIFCFIYKFRQRFGIVVQAIAERLGLKTEDFVETYRGKGMYLDDLSCCKEACVDC